MKTLSEFKDRLTPEEYEHCKTAIKEGGKNVITTIQVYEITKDHDDFVHSIKKLFKLGKKWLDIKLLTIINIYYNVKWKHVK